MSIQRPNDFDEKFGDEESLHEGGTKDHQWGWKFGFPQRPT